MIRSCITPWKKASKFLYLFLLLLLQSLYAQDIDSKYFQVKALEVDSVSKKVTVFYSKGYEERGIELCQLYEKAVTLFKDSLNVMFDLHVAALNEADWKIITNRIPYGVPWIDGPPYVAFLPAIPGKGSMTMNISASKIPPEIIQELKSLGITLQYMTENFVDIIGIHEMGHAYLELLKMKPKQKWFNELLANYFMTAFVKYERPDLLRMWQLRTQIAKVVRAKATQKPNYTSLEDFEKLYFNVGLDNYRWYQRKFQQRVDEIIDLYGFAFLGKVREKRLHNETDIESLLKGLESIAPGFLSWANTFSLIDEAL
jgi:hypothetical protein